MNVRPYIPGQKNFKKRTVRSGAFLNKVFFVFFGLLMALGVVVYVIWGSGWFRVTNIVVQPASISSSAIAQKQLEGWLKERTWIFARGANIFFVREHDIISFFDQNFPELEISDFERSGLHELKIDIQHKIPFARYCARGKPCLLVDESGESYALASASVGPALLYIEDLSAGSGSFDTPIRRKNVLSEDQIRNYREIRDRLRVLNLAIHAFEIPEASFLLRVRLTSGCQLIFDTTSNLQTQLGILAQILAGTLKEVSLNTVEYIDVSVRGKVYYKLLDGRNDSGGEM